ncbi:MAG: hypothetical protein K2X03_28985 [Bryobacteraceae bacterium]|nr:hypothetical protein [Bryobacteraceae bacterium]
MLPALVLDLVLALAPGNPLPPLKGEFLTGRTVTLPEGCAGKVTFLAIGFTYQSRFAVEAWTKRFRAEFDRDPRVTFFEVPMIGGMAVMGKWFIDRGMRRGTPLADQEHVITVYRGVGDWKKHLGFRVPEAGYFVLLDPSGRVVWRHSSVTVDEPAFADLAARVKSISPVRPQ